MKKITILFAASLLLVATSQVGATGFAPNMFVAQKQLNQSSASSSTVHTPAQKASPTKQKESTQPKETSKESFKFLGKRLKPEMTATSFELIKTDALIVLLYKVFFKWVVASLTFLI